MVTVLRELFATNKQPTQESKESAVEALASILEQAQRIGHEHAKDELERGIAWGGSFSNLLSSAWNIVNNFVSRIGDWIRSWGAEQGREPTPEEIQEKIDSLADTVANVEVQTAIEQSVLNELQAQGFKTVKWHNQPDACERCVANSEQGPIPVGTAFESGDESPPAHDKCRCSIGPGDE